MKSSTLLFINILFFVLISKAQMSGVYTVNKNGMASDSVFLSFKSLTDSLHSKGVNGTLIINVTPNSGPYRDNIQLHNVKGLTNNDSIIFNGNSNEIITVVDSNNRTCFYAGNISNLTISDFKFTMVDSMRFAFWRDIVGIHGNFKSLIIKDCQLKFKSINSTPFYYGSAKRYINLSAIGKDGSTANSNIKNVSIEHVVAKGGAYIGCYKYYSNITSDTVSNQWIFQNNEIKDVFYGLYWVGAIANQIMIQNNIIENSDSGRFWNNNFFYAFLINDLQGSTAMPVKNRTFIMSKNLIRNDYGISQSNQNCIGIRLNSRFRERVEISNNIIELTGRTNSFIELNNYQLSSRGTISTIAHNTLLLDKEAKSTTPMSANFIKGTNIYTNVYEELYVKNNLLFSSSKNLGTLSGIDVRSSNIGDSLTYISNNLFYTGTDSFNTYFSGNNCSVTTSSDRINCLIFDTSNLIGIDPEFLSLQNLRYVPTNLFAYKKGTPIVSIKTDYFDQDRSATTPQIGAIESLRGLLVSEIFNDLDSLLCTNQEGTFSFVVENNSGIDIENFVIELSVNEEVKIIENFRKKLRNGQVDTFKFSEKLILNGTGQQKIDIYVAGTNLDSTHLYKSIMITLKSRPSGITFLPKLNTNKYFFDGDSLNPDVILITDKLTYDLEIPSHYSLSNRGNNWDILNISYSNNFNSIDSTVGLVFDIPNGEISFVPIDSNIGELVTLRFLFEDFQTGCDTTLERKIRVLKMPNPDFDFSSTCFGDTTLFINNTSYDGTDDLEAIWYFDENGKTSTFWNTNYNYENIGLKNVELKVRFENFPNYVFPINKSIIIADKPLPNFKINGSCVNDSIHFIDLSDLDSLVSSNAIYYWDFGDNLVTSKAMNPNYKYDKGDNYDVTLRINVQGCEGEIKKDIAINNSPLVDFEMNYICLFDTLFVKNKTTIEEGNISYTWDFNGDGSSKEENTNFLFNNDGIKIIKLTAQSDLGCTDSLIKELKLGHKPELVLDNNVACFNTITGFKMNNLNTDVAVIEWSWKIDDNVVSNSDSLIFTFMDLEDIVLQVRTKTNMDCEIIQYDTIFVLDKPTADFEVSNICQGQDATFTNTSIALNDRASYAWFFGDGHTSTKRSPSHNYGNLIGLVSVTLEVIYTNGCEDQVVKQIAIEKAPSAEFDVIFIEAKTVNVRAKEDDLIYRWQMGDGVRYETQEVIHRYQEYPDDETVICLTTRNEANCWSLQYCLNILGPWGAKDILSNQKDWTQLYPNPNQGIFNISFSNIQGEVEVAVFDLLGNALPSDIHFSKPQMCEINLGQVAAGVYLVRLKNGDQWMTQKVTVSK